MRSDVEHHHLLTGHGELWDLREPEICRLLSRIAGNAGSTLSHAVAAFGFIYLRQRGDRLRIRLRPDAFPQRVFEALALELSRRHAARIAIEFAPSQSGEDPAIAAELFPNLQDAIAYLDALRSLTPGEIDRPHFFSTELDLKRLPSQSRQKLRSAYTAWARARGELGKERLSQMRNNPLDAPLLLTRLGAAQTFVIETWPKYLTLVPQADIQSILGGQIEDLPYPGSYPVEASAVFREASKRQTPILDLVEAIIYYQSAPPCRVRYERLCLPWRGPHDETFVSTISSFRSKRVVGQ